MKVIPTSNDTKLATALSVANENFHTVDTLFGRYGTGFDLFFKLHEESAGYQGVYYESFSSEYIHPHIVWLPDLKAIRTDAVGTAIEVLIMQHHPLPLESFWLHLDAASDESNVLVEVSQDHINWSPCQLGLNSGLSFQNLWVRLTINSVDTLIHSFGVLYDKVEYSRYSEKSLLERLQVEQATTGQVLTVPNQGKYVANGKSLEVTFLPSSPEAGSRLLWLGVDYLEYSRTEIQLLRNFPAGYFVFRERLNLTKLERLEADWLLEYATVSPAVLEGMPRLYLDIGRTLDPTQYTGRRIRISTPEGMFHAYIRGVQSIGPNQTRFTLSKELPLAIGQVAYGSDPTLAPAQPEHEAQIMRLEEFHRRARINSLVGEDILPL